MLRVEHTYRTLIFGALSALLLLWNSSYASSNQDMISLAAQTLGIELGNTAPSSAYNSVEHEYLIVYTKYDTECTNERLFGITINALTGEKGIEFPISDCNTYIKNPRVEYDGDHNKFGVFYKSSNGSGASLIFRTIDASTKSIGIKNEFGVKTFSDPYEKNILAYSSNYFIVGYHEVAGSSDTKLNLKLYNTINQQFETNLLFDKNNFLEPNGGLQSTQIVSNNDNEVFICFELKLSSGSEIYGGFLNLLTTGIKDDFFSISPQAAGSTIFLNPNAIRKSEADDILVVYEESYIQGPNAALNKKIKGQLISSTSGVSFNPINISITNLPPDNNYEEDSKMPNIVYSELSKEFVVHFYGRRWINETLNKYHNYIQRIDCNDLSPINSESIKVSNEIGTSIDNNFGLKILSISYNSTNNQFLLTWMDESISEIFTQIWRYDNNPPKNLDLTQKTRNENLLVGTTFSTITSEDPDPEDATITYSLVSGTGDTDNSYFSIDGDKLIVSISPNFEEKETLSIRIRATDTNGASTDKAFVLSINDIPEDPKNILLAEPLDIMENSAQFTSAITVIDDDIGDTHTSRLAPGDSSTNNANFTIDGNTLQLINPVSFEDSHFQFIRIEAIDGSNNKYSKGFAIRVTDINEPADTVYVSPGSIPENDPNAFVSVVIEDPDETSDYTISLTAGEGGEDNKYFTPVDNKLVPTTEFNFEEKSEYYVRILIKEGGYTDTAMVVINIEDLNDQPDSITLSNNILMDGRGSGFKIGKVTTYDQDVDDTHDYTVIEGGGLFFIDDNDSLVTKIPLVYDYQDESANKYNIIIISDDNRGETIEQSFTIELIPFQDTEKPKFGPNLNPAQFIAGSNEMALSINATDNEELDTAFIYYRKIRSTDDFVKDSLKIEWAGNKSFTINKKINQNLLDNLGLEYYFQIYDASGNHDSTAVNYIYVKHESMPFEATSKLYDGSSTSYRIITNPYELGSNKISAIFSDYGDSNKDNWRLYKFENGKNIEIGTNRSAELEPGRAYWFNKSSDLKNSITLEKPEPLEYNRTQLKEIALEQGWNLVGNPYPFTLDWESILAYNMDENIHAEAYGYDKEYEILNTLEMFEGAFVYANNKTTIQIPVLGHQAGSRIAKSDESLFDWLVNFNLSNEKINYKLSAIGMHEKASESFDRFDTPLLPRFINYADLAFEHPEHHSGAFTKDISDIQENHIWEFIASTNSSDKQFQLNWNYPELPSTDKQLILYDINNNISMDMSLNNSYNVNLDDPVAFKAIYGDKAFVDGILSNIEVQALNPYPNPFKTAVNLPVVLPQSNLDYEVSCSIFNLMGEKIYQQVDTGIPYGTYDIIWSDDKSFNKGIYIYSIKVKNKFLSREFHGRLVKD